MVRSSYPPPKPKDEKPLTLSDLHIPSYERNPHRNGYSIFVASIFIGWIVLMGFLVTQGGYRNSQNIETKVHTPRP